MLLNMILILAPHIGLMPAQELAHDLGKSPAPALSVYLLAQESMFRKGITGPTQDHGIGQIQASTGKAAGCNYQGESEVDCHSRVLRMKLAMCKGNWTCYHSTTPHWQAVYRKAVQRHQDKVRRHFCFTKDYPLKYNVYEEAEAGDGDSNDSTRTSDGEPL